MALLWLVGFLAVTAIGGGITLVAGVFTPPVEMLQGSVFRSYLIPGLALGVLVGGTAAAALIMLLRRHRWSAFAGLGAALAIVLFELIEIAVIGSPRGAPRNMQVLYLGVGVVIAVLAIASRTAKGKA